MKNRVIGLLIVLFFLFSAFFIEQGSMRIQALLAPSVLMIVFGATAGLTVANYRKGMEIKALLTKVKRYFIYSGIFGTILGVILIFNEATGERIASGYLLKQLSLAALCSLYGLLAAMITDTFISE